MRLFASKCMMHDPFLFDALLTEKKKLNCKCYYLYLLSLHLLQPRLHFFKDGKKVGEIIGADVERLKYTMEKLYE